MTGLTSKGTSTFSAAFLPLTNTCCFVLRMTMERKTEKPAKALTPFDDHGSAERKPALSFSCAFGDSGAREQRALMAACDGAVRVFSRVHIEHSSRILHVDQPLWHSLVSNEMRRRLCTTVGRQHAAASDQPTRLQAIRLQINAFLLSISWLWVFGDRLERGTCSTLCGVKDVANSASDPWTPHFVAS